VVQRNILFPNTGVLCQVFILVDKNGSHHIIYTLGKPKRAITTTGMKHELAITACETSCFDVSVNSQHAR